MVWKAGSKHSVSSSRVIARRNDWNSIGDLHQGPRSMTASRGRIHDRSPIRLPKHQKVLAERGPSIHDDETYFRYLAARFCSSFALWSGSLEKEGAGNTGRSMPPQAAY